MRLSVCLWESRHRSLHTVVTNGMEVWVDGVRDIRPSQLPPPSHCYGCVHRLKDAGKRVNMVNTGEDKHKEYPGCPILFASAPNWSLPSAKPHIFKEYISLADCCSLVAKSFLTLCDPMDCSPPGSSVYGISQGRILEWWPFPPPGDLPDPGIEPTSPALAGGFFTGKPPGRPLLADYFLPSFNGAIPSAVYHP